MQYFNCSLTILPLSVCMHACVLSVSVCECAPHTGRMVTGSVVYWISAMNNSVDYWQVRIN